MDRHPAAPAPLFFPESSLGFWTPTVRAALVKALQESDATVIAGAAHHRMRTGYDNVLVAIQGRRSNPLSPTYACSRVDVAALARPAGSERSARAHFFANPAVVTRRRRSDRTADLLRATDRLARPAVPAAGAGFIVAVGNGWWTKGTSIVATQRAQQSRPWGALFAKANRFFLQHVKHKGDAMLDAALIQQCAEPLVEAPDRRAVRDRAGQMNPLAVTVKSGGRLILIPKATSRDEAMRSSASMSAKRWCVSA